MPLKVTRTPKNGVLLFKMASELYKMPNVYLSRATQKGKKWQVQFENPSRTVAFGAQGYQDYTQHKDSKRKDLYIDRHKTREDWTSSGKFSAGFWSRWLLWNKPTLEGSIRSIENKFGFDIKRGARSNGSDINKK